MGAADVEVIEGRRPSDDTKLHVWSTILRGKITAKVRERDWERERNIINIMSTGKMTGLSMLLKKMWLTVLSLMHIQCPLPITAVAIISPHPAELACGHVTCWPVKCEWR